MLRHLAVLTGPKSPEHHDSRLHCDGGCADCGGLVMASTVSPALDHDVPFGDDGTVNVAVAPNPHSGSAHQTSFHGDAVFEDHSLVAFHTALHSRLSANMEYAANHQIPREHFARRNFEVAIQQQTP